jgi:hypothetical protein
VNRVYFVSTNVPFSDACARVGTSSQEYQPLSTPRLSNNIKLRLCLCRCTPPNRTSLKHHSIIIIVRFPIAGRLFPFVHHQDMFLVPMVRPNVRETIAPVFPSASYSTTTLDVNVRTPKYEGGAFPYRHHVMARLWLTGTVPPQFNQVVLGPTTPNESQLVLYCHAQCGACISSQHPQCSPTGWYLDPLHDPKHNLGFILDPLSGTLTGNVTFTIQHRPRQPKPHDQTRRCGSESLM